MSKDKVALVTGASRGAGAGIARGLGELGYTVYVTGRTVDAGTAPLPGTVGETAAEVDRRGGKGIVVEYRVRSNGCFFTCAYTRNVHKPWAMADGLEGSPNFAELVRPDGCRLYYETHGEPANPALLLIEGMGGDIPGWRRNIPMLATACFGTIDVRSRDLGAAAELVHMATLLHEMKRRKARYGLETMCVGGGQGIAAVFQAA